MGTEKNLDKLDWAILAELQADARLSMNELSRRINLSPPSVAERVRRLEDTGVITGYHTHVDPTLAGRSVRAIIRMQCYGPTCLLRDPAVVTWPEVLTMHRVTGEDCSVLHIAVKDLTAFEELLDKLSDYGRPSSSLIVDEVLPYSSLESPIDFTPKRPRALLDRPRP